MVIKTLLKTLAAGQTSLSFTDEECDDSMIYDVFVESLDLFPTNVSVTGHTVTVNFKEASIDTMQVKIVVNALDGSLDGSDIPYDNTDTSLTSDNVEDAIDELDNNISANVSDIEQLQLDMVQAQTDIAGKADSFTVDTSINLSEGRVLSTEASIIPFDNSLIGIVSTDVQGAIEEAYNHGGGGGSSLDYRKTTTPYIVGYVDEDKPIYRRYINALTTNIGTNLEIIAVTGSVYYTVDGGGQRPLTMFSDGTFWNSSWAYTTSGNFIISKGNNVAGIKNCWVDYIESGV